MAKIIYKEGCEGQNKMYCIEGIEIELLNRQKVLIYPKYTARQMLMPEYISKWSVKDEIEIEALKVEDTNGKTAVLLNLGSPAAAWVSLFGSDKYGNFCLPSLLAAMEIQHQKAEIDVLAKTIEGADLLKDFTSFVWSCSRCNYIGCWCSCSNGAYANFLYLDDSCLVVPTILYR